MKIRLIQKATILSTLLLAPFAQAELVIQQFNDTTGSVVSTTAPEGSHWKLAGSVLDLTAFSNGDNPYGWQNWQNYTTVSVANGVLEGKVATGIRFASSSLISAPNAYIANMNEYRYLAVTYSKECNLGHILVAFGKDGGSIVTEDQHGIYKVNSATFENEAVNTVILDLSAIPAWKNGDMTRLGIELHQGVAEAKENTLIRIYRISLSTEIAEVPGT